MRFKQLFLSTLLALATPTAAHAEPLKVLELGASNYQHMIEMIQTYKVPSFYSVFFLNLKRNVEKVARATLGTNQELPLPILAPFDSIAVQLFDHDSCEMAEQSLSKIVKKWNPAISVSQHKGNFFVDALPAAHIAHLSYPEFNDEDKLIMVLANALKQSNLVVITSEYSRETIEQALNHFDSLHYTTSLRSGWGEPRTISQIPVGGDQWLGRLLHPLIHVSEKPSLVFAITKQQDSAWLPVADLFQTQHLFAQRIRHRIVTGKPFPTHPLESAQSTD